MFSAISPAKGSARKAAVRRDRQSRDEFSEWQSFQNDRRSRQRQFQRAEDSLATLEDRSATANETRQSALDPSEESSATDVPVYKPRPADVPALEEALTTQTWPTAWRLFKDICANDTAIQSLPDETLTNLLRLAVKNSTDASLTILTTMKQLSRTLTPTHYNLLIESYARTGQVTEARKTLSQMSSEGHNLTMETYNLFLKLHVRTKDTPGAITFFDKMVHEGIAPTLESYNVIISGCCDANDAENATKYFREMTDLGIDPDPTTYNHLIRLQVRLNNMPSALSILSQMQQKGIKPSELILTTLMTGYIKSSNPSGAISIFDDLTSQGVTPDAITYCTVISAKAKSGNLQSALQSLRTASTLPDFKTDSGPAPKTYQTLMEYCCKEGDFVTAENLLVEFTSRAGRAFAMHYEALCLGYTQRGKHLDAHRVFEQHLSNRGFFQTPIYNEVMKCAALAFDIETVEAVWSRLTSGDTKVKPDPMSYAIYLESLLSVREMNGSMEILKEMLHRGIEPDPIVWVTLIEGNLEGRDFRSAVRCIEWMRKSASRGGDLRGWVRDYKDDFEEIVASF
ncbi:hypothetical protein HK097_001476, partial [Rhizophlyctis rosea]